MPTKSIFRKRILYRKFHHRVNDFFSPSPVSPRKPLKFMNTL